VVCLQVGCLHQFPEGAFLQKTLYFPSGRVSSSRRIFSMRASIFNCSSTVVSSLKVRVGK